MRKEYRSNAFYAPDDLDELCDWFDNLTNESGFEFVAANIQPGWWLFRRLEEIEDTQENHDG